MDPVLVHTIRKKSTKKNTWFGTTEEDNDICGLAILDKELFVIVENSSEIEVYDSVKFNICRQWNLKELINPKDIASCRTNQCLYILDYKTTDQSSEILRVATNGKLLTKWSTGVGASNGLSVTSEANIILTAYLEHTLNEYFPDGQLIREIYLSSDVHVHVRNPIPHYAVKLANGNFLICGANFCDYQHTVCTVDADGKLEKSFGGKCGSTNAQVSFPVYLSVDGNGFVMVADPANCRVLLLDSDLQFKREILSRGGHGLGLQYPNRILLDESTGRLFVADKRSILIFEFK